MPQKITLKAKLFRPRITADFVERIELFRKLSSRTTSGRLTLVSAPAGYGKSMTISRWLEISKNRHTWLSLSEEDSDLFLFFNYFVTAVQKLFPDSCTRTKALLNAPAQCSKEELAGVLINNLSELDEEFYLVLDDYGYIHDQDIHHVLNVLLEYDLPSLHLVVITRRDPPFSLIKLRGKGALLEIRQAHLQFTLEETNTFLNTILPNALDGDDFRVFYNKIEGWPAGLRMAALGLGDRTDIKEYIREMRGDSRDIREYLMSEVLSRQKPAVREYLVKTSILSRLCPSLCEALCDQPEMDGAAFLKQLELSNLFCIPLDEHHEWFRYHHLFQYLLQFTLEKRYSSDEIKDLHERAFLWLSKNGFIEEALQHALVIDDIRSAASLIIDIRSQLMNREEWHRLRRLLCLLPGEVIKKEPEFLMLEAWALVGLPEMEHVLGPIEDLMRASPQRYPRPGRLWGELLALKSLQNYNQANPEAALQQSLTALDYLPPENSSERGFAMILQAMSLQMLGHSLKAQRLIHEALQKSQATKSSYHARLLVTLCCLHGIDGSIQDLQQTATRYLQLGKENDLAETIAHAHFFLGMSSYEYNDLETALFHLSSVARNIEALYLANRNNYIHSGFVLALVYHEMGLASEAASITDDIVTLALRINNPYILSLVKAFQAELSLRAGKFPEAFEWEKTFDTLLLRPAYRFYVPQLTLAKVYLTKGTEKSLQKADLLLFKLDEYYVRTNNRNMQIKVLALQALLYNKLGRCEQAMTRLSDSLCLAEPREFIRTFVDLGDDMARLLATLPENHAQKGYADRLLAHFPSVPSGEAETQKIPNGFTSKHHIDTQSFPLITNRELDILSLLSKRRSNQEIADQLYISYSTVKRHNANIYQKLEVSNRRQAVSRALSLGILST